MMVAMVLFWGAILLGVAWFIRGAARGGSVPEERFVSKESPVEILERPFAEGRITPEEYRARREVLANRAAPNGARKDDPLTAPQITGGRQC